MAFTAGQKLRASDLNGVGNIVGKNLRTSTTVAAVGPVSVLSVRAPVVAGRSYRCSLNSECFGSVSDSLAQHDVHFTTNDVEPTSSDTVLFRALVTHASPTTGIPETISTFTVFDSVATGFLRLLHTVTRVTGSGNVSVSAGAVNPTWLTVEDIGPTIATSGTVY